MNVLDPFQVAEIEVWPLIELDDLDPGKARGALNSAEYTVFEKVVNESSFEAILNEKDVLETKKDSSCQRHIVVKSSRTALRFSKTSGHTNRTSSIDNCQTCAGYQ